MSFQEKVSLATSHSSLTKTQLPTQTINTLFNLIDQIAQAAFIHMGNQNLKEVYINVREIKGMDPLNQDFYKLIHQYLQKRSEERRHAYFSEEWLLIPKSMSPTVDTYIQQTGNETIESLLNEFALERTLERLNLNLFVQEVNNNLELGANREIYLRTAKKKVLNIFKTSSEIGSEDKSYPNISQGRMDLLTLFNIRHDETQELVLTKYCELLEMDPNEKNTLSDLVRGLKQLMQEFDEGYFNSVGPTLFLLAIKAIALNLGCMVIQSSSQRKNLGVQQEELKVEAMKVAKSFEQMNVHDFTDVSFYAKCARYAADILRSDVTLSDVFAEGMVRAARTSTKIIAVVFDPKPGPIYEAVKEISADITFTLDKLTWKHAWYERALTLKCLTNTAKYDPYLFQTLIPEFRDFRKEKGEVAKKLVHSFILTLENVIQQTKITKIQQDALTLLIEYLFIDNPKLQERTMISLRYLFENGSNVVRYTSYLILRWLGDGDHINNKDQNETLRRIPSYLRLHSEVVKEIKEPQQIFMNVCKFFLRKVTASEGIKDYAGISPLCLMAYSTIDEKILALFSEVDALKNMLTDLYGNNPYHHAAFNDNARFVRYLSAHFHEININEGNHEKITPLHTAILERSSQAFQALLKMGADVHQINGNGDTPLHLICKMKSMEMLLQIREFKDVDLNKKNYDQKTPLDIALESDFVEGVYLLRGLSAHISQSHEGMSLITKAAYLGSKQVLKELIIHEEMSLRDMGEILEFLTREEGQSFRLFHLENMIFNRYYREKAYPFFTVSQPRIYLGDSPLSLNFYNNWINSSNQDSLTSNLKRMSIYDTITVFRRGDDRIDLQDENGNTQLMLLTRFHTDKALRLAEQLLDSNVNIHISNNTGLTVLELATLFNNQKMLQLLRSYHPECQSKKVTIRVGKAEEALDPLNHAIVQGNFKKAQTCNVSGNVDVAGNNPYIYLAGKNWNEAASLAQHLYQEGLGVETQNKFSMTPVIAATCHRNIGFIQFLKEKGANLNVGKREGMAPIHIACYLRDLNLIKALVKAKASLKTPNAFGELPIHLVAGTNLERFPKAIFFPPLVPENFGPTESDELKLLEYVSKKTNLLVQDNNGDNPLHRAVKWGTPLGVQFLLKNAPQLFLQPNHQGLIPLALAVQKGSPMMLQAFEHLPSIDGLKKEHFFLLAQAGLNDLVDTYVAKTSKAVTYVDEKTNHNLLHLGALSGNIGVLKHYENNQLSSLNKENNNALHLAALHGHLPFIKEVVAKDPALIHSTNYDGRTGLHLAVIEGHIEIVRYFLEHFKEGVHWADDYGDTPLHLAVKYRQATIVHDCLMYQAKTFMVNDERKTPLHIASEVGDSTIIALLVEGFARTPDAEEKKVQETIEFDNWYAYKRRVRPQMPGESFNLNALDSDENSCLNLSVIHRNQQCVRALLSVGASIETTDFLGNTPLLLACCALDPQIVKDLIDFDKGHKGQLVFLKNQKGECAYHQLFKKNIHKDYPTYRTNRLRILRQLYQEKLGLSEEDQAGNTVLHLAVRAGAISFVEEMLKLGPVDLMKRNKKGQTPLHVAALHNQANFIGYLAKQLKQGHTFSNFPNYKDLQNETPLFYAAKQGYVDTFMELYKHGADPTLVNKKGETLIHVILDRQEVTPNHVNILEKIIRSYPGLLYVSTHEKWTPLHVIAKRNHYEHIDLILKNLGGFEERKMSFRDQKNNQGETCYDVAVKYHSEAALRALNIFQKSDIGIDEQARSDSLSNFQKVNVRYKTQKKYKVREMDTVNFLDNSINSEK